MSQETRDSNKKPTNKNLPSQTSLMVRILVGGYLLYTSYSLVGSFINSEDTHKYMLGAFIVFFAVVGILLIIFSGKDLLCGKYLNGKMDKNAIEERPESLEEARQDEREP